MSRSSAEFVPLERRIRQHAAATPERAALVDDERVLSWAEVDTAMDTGVVYLSDAGVGMGDTVAILGPNSAAYAVVYLAAIRAGAVPAPLPSGAAADALAVMLSDSGAKLLLIADEVELPPEARTKSETLEDVLADWISVRRTGVAVPEVTPDDWFNIIYSSGTTGVPKGIIQTHRMRHMHMLLGEAHGYDPSSVSLLSTPLYSNTTLISFFATIAAGGTAVLMRKFDPEGFLERAQKHQATEAMLVPVQYRRLLEHPDFDRFDLSSFRTKFCTSAPFSAELKSEVLRRWPGGLIEYYGMTEGGGLCVLEAHKHRDKLHTVGCPAPDNDIRLIDDDGVEIERTSIGEIVGRSDSLMPGYFNRPEQTAEAFWTSPEGRIFMRTGDVGRFDDDGFLTLMDRKKDLIISGGFNVYPSDLEEVARSHPAVVDVAIVGVASDRWGETPVAFVVARGVDSDTLKAFVNERVGKVQRLSDVRIVEQLPRNPIGKVLKRELRDLYLAGT